MNTTKKWIPGLLLLFTAVTLSPACRNAAQKQDSSDVANDKNEQKFDDKAKEKQASLLVEVVAAGYQSLQLADLALQKSTRPEVKAIAGGLKAAHTALLDQFKAYAVKRNISVPGEQTKEARETNTRLAELPPEKFDKQWCELLIEQHRKTIADMENALKDEQEEDARKLFSAVLPPLREQNDKLMQYHHRL